MWHTARRRKWGEKGVIERAHKNCQSLSSSREIYYRPTLQGNPCSPFAVWWDHTPPLLRKAAQPIIIHCHFWAFAKPQSGKKEKKKHLKTQKAGSHLWTASTHFCTVILLNEVRWERLGDWNARATDGILLHARRLPLIESADMAFRSD